MFILNNVVFFCLQYQPRSLSRGRLVLAGLESAVCAVLGESSGQLRRAAHSASRPARRHTRSGDVSGAIGQRYHLHPAEHGRGPRAW